VLSFSSWPAPGCPSKSDRGVNSFLPAQLGSQVSELAASELEIENTRELKIPELGNRKTEIMTLHPLENEQTRAQYTPPLRGLVSKMRTAFFFRPVAQQWTTRLQRTGAIDDDELWRAGPSLGKERDFRVFQQHNIESSPDTSITLLLDISGSMNGEKMRTAIQAAAIMHEVLKTTPGVRVRVRAHTGDVPPATGDQSIIYKVWENGEPVSRLGIPITVRHGNNYDGYAIGWCVTEMLRHAKPEEQRILIVLSDGLPHGRGYGGEEAMQHVKTVQKWARQKGVDVIQIAIDPNMDPHRQAKMFDSWLPFTNLQALPGQLTAIMKKAIK
jgi:nitric oxide reductase activation protein